MAPEKENAHIDLSTLGQMKTAVGKNVVMEVRERKIELFTQSPEPYHGSGSKRIVLNRFIELDDLFFEGLGLWVGEGGKNKGLYFGNSSLELLLHFLRYVERKLGICRRNFKVTLNVPTTNDGWTSKKKWSDPLQIPAKNFTRICIDPRISREYAQIYFNSIVLVELMKTLQKKLEPEILSTKEFAVPFLRGMFAAEGQVALRKHGALHATFSTADPELLSLLKESLGLIGISSGKYMPQSRKFPIYGYKNLKRFKGLGIHTLHPEKRTKFELGFSNYKRINILRGDEARALILQQLASGPKTYDELAAALGKARTTIQAWHIPILEREGKVKRAGKCDRAWLWALAESKSSVGPNINRAPCAEPTCSSLMSPTISC